MKVRSHPAAVGFLAAALLSVPLMTASVAAPAKNKKPAKPAAAAKGDPKAGKDQFKSEGCAGCHKTKEFPDAGALGPDLSKIAANHTAAQISKEITHPKPGSQMPAFKGPKKILDNLVAYMLTQK